MIEQEVYRGLKSKGLLSLPYGAVEGGGRIEVLSIPPSERHNTGNFSKHQKRAQKTGNLFLISCSPLVRITV